MSRAFPLRLYALVALLTSPIASAADTLPALTPDRVPRTVAELYAGFDPDREPLDARVVREFERDGVVVRLVTYTVGTFKGKPSVMGGYYAFPKAAAGRRLPAVLHMHGGGQRAGADTVVAWARNGYAALAMNWGGRAMEDQRPGDAGTDWGAVDPSQQTHNGHYSSCQPDERTIDPFESPRNSNWFLITLAARRGVTFLQRQPEVDPARVGATGHSMGGKLTVMLAGCDGRIKAAAPSCGGTGDAPDALRARPGNAARPPNPSRPYAECIDDVPYLKRVTCPIVYLGPQNDFNGMVDELFLNWPVVPSTEVAYAISKHLNHRHEAAAAFVDALWFDRHLKGGSPLPKTPGIAAVLKGPAGVPVATVTPDRPAEVARVELFYSVDPNGQFRFWRSADAKRVGDAWVADCPILSADMPVLFMANVHYPFPKPELVGPPGARSPGPTFLLSTKVLTFEVPAVRAAGPALTDAADRTLERDFVALQDWYVLERGNPVHQQLVTRKVKDPNWRGPDGATLALDVLDPRGGELALSLEFNAYAQYGREKPTGEFHVAVPIKPSPDWQTVEVRLADLKPTKPGTPMPQDWQTLCTLTLAGRITLKDAAGNPATTIGDGHFDASRKLRNLRWVGGTYPKSILMPGGAAALDPSAYDRQFQGQIDRSIELEKRDRGGR